MLPWLAVAVMKLDHYSQSYGIDGLQVTVVAIQIIVLQQLACFVTRLLCSRMHADARLFMAYHQTRQRGYPLWGGRAVMSPLSCWSKFRGAWMAYAVHCHVRRAAALRQCRHVICIPRRLSLWSKLKG